MQGIATRLTSSLRLIVAASLATALLAGTSASAATIYKSVDKHGNVTFSQTPPKDRPSQTIEANAPPATETADTTSNKEEAPAADNDRATDPTTEVKVVDRDKARETCQKAREQREAVANSGNQLMVEDEAGKYQPMTEEQRQERLKRLDAIIEQACTAAGE
ncbi:DUF4124 domain-containing protein [Guyparkeria hydrothermalis]|uniref:DUF4124 domain-containing protein n=1 Tax=Guyparkeria hydrothermalis TaxID=923 RepID=UPI00202127C5|nr:DUF4124 domain-containing protein [Guyparkeria hydrothermalis]MCL7745387.1 DUF4124 domain-containing protein [Guyparkeria hydrothermalis]